MEGYALEHINISKDIQFLYKVMAAEDQYLYSTKLRFPSIQNFEQWLSVRLKNEFHDFFIIRESQHMEPLGYVHNYDFSLVDGHCKLVVYIIPEYREIGIGGMAAITFMKKLFAMYPLRKLYSTIYDYNRESLNSNLAAGFQEEANILDYRYYDGKYHSIHYLSISRQQFEKTIGRLVK